MNLAKDLSSLVSKSKSDMMYIATSSIMPGPWQVRKTFAEQDDIEESIKEHGILEPILLNQTSDGKFLIIGGERRWRAATKLGINQVPARILNVSNDKALILGIIENIQRNSLSSIEEANGYEKMIQSGLTHEQVAQSVGKSRPYISNLLRLLQLPESVQQLVQDGKLNASNARSLVSQKNCEEKALKIVSLKQTVREVESERKPESSEISLIASEISNIIGLKVKILTKGRGGIIQIDYPNLEQLDNFLAKLCD